MSNKPKKSWKDRLISLLTLLSVIFIIFIGYMYAKEMREMYDTPEEAAIYIKNALKNHEEWIDFSCKAESLYAGNIANLDNELWNGVCEYNGKPDEGDFLYSKLSFYSDTVTYTNSILFSSNYKADYKLHVHYATTPEEDLQFLEKTEQILSDLQLQGKSEYEKVKLIYDYICSHVSYNYDALEKHREAENINPLLERYKYDEIDRKPYTAYAAACQNTAVCMGYAELFYYLCNAVGLECRIISNDTHAWNFVKVDGQYYYCDATWDSGSIDQYRFFLKGLNDFELHDGEIQKFFWEEFGPTESSDKQYIERGEFADWEYQVY